MKDEKGSVTAEFAMTLPSLLLLFFFALQIISAITQQQHGEAVAQSIARAITRGESQLRIDEIMKDNFSEAKLSISDHNGVVVVEINENKMKARANGYRPQ